MLGAGLDQERPDAVADHPDSVEKARHWRISRKDEIRVVPTAR
jgi:hypothetical protein